MTMMTNGPGGPGDVTLGAADRAAALAAGKAQLRLATDADDALLVAFLESALGLAEQFTGQVLLARTMEARLLPDAGWQRLPAAPVRGILAVTVGTPPVPLATDAYAVDIDAEAGGWVRIPGAGPATVRFEAGLASDWAGLPAAIRQGVALLAAHLFEDRGGRAAPPAAVTALWRPYRAVRLRQAARA